MTKYSDLCSLGGGPPGVVTAKRLREVVAFLSASTFQLQVHYEFSHRT